MSDRDAFWVGDQVEAGNHVLDGGPDPPGKRHFGAMRPDAAIAVAICSLVMLSAASRRGRAAHWIAHGVVLPLLLLLFLLLEDYAGTHYYTLSHKNVAVRL